MFLIKYRCSKGHSCLNYACSILAKFCKFHRCKLYRVNLSTQVMYIRSYPRRKSLLSNPFLLKGWELVFELTDKSDVERELKASRLNYHWKVKTAATITKRKETNTQCIVLHCSAFYTLGIAMVKCLYQIYTMHLV